MPDDVVVRMRRDALAVVILRRFIKRTFAQCKGSPCLVFNFVDEFNKTSQAKYRLKGVITVDKADKAKWVYCLDKRSIRNIQRVIVRENRIEA